MRTANKRLMSNSTHAMETGSRLPARPRSVCFVCGQENKLGLRIRYQPEGNGEVRAVWRAAATYEGFPGIVHGGIVSTVLDEVMSKAVAAAGANALTAELRVRFRQPVAVQCDYVIRGWIVYRHRRLIETEASLITPEGVEHAHAWARFLTRKAGSAGLASKAVRPGSGGI